MIGIGIIGFYRRVSTEEVWKQMCFVQQCAYTEGAFLGDISGLQAELYIYRVLKGHALNYHL